MKRYDKFDDQTEGQITIEEFLEPPERLYAVSRIFARARRDMSLSEQKTFVYALSELKFTEEAKTNVVYLDKKTLAKIVGVGTDPNHLSVDLHNKIRELSKHSYIEISKEDADFFDSGVVITRVTMLKNRVRIKFEKEYMGLFTGLSTEYITMWSSDVFGMQSKRSVQFYEYLRQNTDTREKLNQAGFGVKALKELFNIPMDGEGSYMRKDGHFDRASFERRIIEPLCEDLSKCKMITLQLQPDGKYYEKVKRGNRVLGYRFYWTFSADPRIATASEVKQIQERVDKNPEILKVAKDIIKGDAKKKKGNASTNSFNNFGNQRNYDEDFLKQLERTQPK